jgi:hypothetical protein
MRYVIPIIIVSTALLALDFYVYRNWRRFAQDRRRLQWTMPVYRVLMLIMPFSMPLYLNLFRWWEVEPRLARALFFGIWSFYYVPKVAIALVLLAKDVVRFSAGLARRVGQRSPHAAVGAERGMENASDSLLAAPSPARADANAASRPDADAGAHVDAQAMSRSEFLRRMGWTAAAVPFVATGYGVLRTLYDFRVHRIDVPLAGLPRQFDGITIAQLSDLHAGSLFSDQPMWDAVSIVNELKPDLIAVTGDFVNNDTAEMPRVLPALSALTADLGVFGCLGNHDHYAQTDQLLSQIRSTPINVLVNEHQTLTVDGARLHVVGTDNTGFNQRYADLPRALAGIESDDEGARILLAHDPSFWDAYVRPNYSTIDLMICGHTHGGQFGFEFGPLRWSVAQMRYDRWAGLYAEPRRDGDDPQWLYVNRGIGTVGPPLRLGIPPEITLLTLHCVATRVA